MSGILEDHPRLCGEKVQQHKAAVRIQGSPPPMRGKVASAVIACMCVGITPAYAGKSRRFSNQLLFGKDHPRLCGEKLC